MNRPKPLLIHFFLVLSTSAAVLTAVSVPTEATLEFRLTLVIFAGLGLLFWHAYRGLGFVNYASTLWLLTLVAGWIFQWLPYWLIGSCCGLVFGSLVHYAIQSRVGLWVLSILIGLVAPQIALNVIEFTTHIPTALTVLVAFIALLSWLRLFRPWFELNIEVPLWISFHIRGSGPGLKGFPVHGPCIVIANHACWFDPIILAKLLPRTLTPMMTGRFYDLPVISFLMRRFGIIKVRETPMKRELPEVQEAIAALDRGECVVVFPEGYLRRSEDRPLKRFGQGIWQILKARPHTPVYACWIEGNWGSFTSYCNGKPTKNKKRDVRRPIRVGMSSAIVLDQAVLEQHLSTRIFLMNRVSEARSHLELPSLPTFELPRQDEDEAE